MKRELKVLLTIISAILFFSAQLVGQGTNIPITTDSDEAREAFIIGRQKRENIQLEAAGILFNHAIELDPEFALAYLYRGLPSDRGKALELIDNVSEGEKLTILYFIASESYDLKEARDYLSQLLERFPSNKHVHLWAGLFYENILHDYQLALDHFYIATRLDETYAAPYNEIGYRHMRLGNFEKAEEAFKKYIELAPECPNAYDSYANYLMKLKRYDESIRQYSEVYDLNPDKTITIARIGQNYAFRGEYDEARSYYDRYYQMAENIGQKATALSLSSASFIAEGKIKEAVKEMKDYIKLAEKTNSNIDIIVGTANVGFIYLEMGYEKEGLKEYLKAEKLLKTLELPESTRKRYEFSSLGWLCRAYIANNDREKSEEYLSRAKKIVDETRNPLYLNEYNMVKGYFELRTGNYKAAIDNLLQCSQDDPYNIYTLAKAYHLAEDEQDALELSEVLDSWENFGLEYSVSRINSRKLMSVEQ